MIGATDSPVAFPEKANPPAYHDDSKAAPPATDDTSPPTYDFTDNKPLSADDEKKRLAAADEATATASLSSSTPSSSAITQTTWHITTDSRLSDSFVVTSPSGTDLYRIQKRGRSPQLRLVSLTTGQEIGQASFLSGSRVVDIDMHSVKDVELRPLDMRSRDYAYSSPSLMRKLTWHRHSIAGHVTGMSCHDERKDEVATWSKAGMSMSKIAKVEFARWVEVGAEEEVRRRKEEILLMGAVVHFKRGIAAKGTHLDEPVGPLGGIRSMGNIGV
ncbi:Hypothetical protein D9617_23g005340 [Elsinoe fawcettii]|nr:Hypothetical protein D9617_23g005340 [Elsinoe fawcettii]